MVKTTDTFNIGQICPESGIYKLTHCACMLDASCDISQKQYTIPLVKGKKFPPCRNCGSSKIKWEFVRKA